MKRQSPVKTLAMLTAAIGLGAGAFGAAQQANPHASKGAILHFPQAASKRQIEMLRAGRSGGHNRKPWPYRGKNRSQRQRMAEAFFNF